MSQPAVSLSAQLLRRAERAGVPAEIADLPAGEASVSDVGRELFALVNRARAEGLDPELELRAAARAYAGRVRAWEAEAAN
jgi:XTP/dITP diphosphohydrolase